MIRLLAKRFVPSPDDYQNPKTRTGYGILCSVVGIALNILLAGIKFTAGLLSGSIAVMADATNNLSDAAASIITLVGFYIGGKAPDSAHPYGHGRMEYLAGLCVSVLIVYMGCTLAWDSVQALIHPTDTNSGILVLVILGISILVKLYMYAYNHVISKKIDSSAMAATAADSISDALSTGLVLLCTILQLTLGWHMDGIGGLVVSALILKTGYESAVATISPLLGAAPSPELVQSIEKMVLAHEDIVGVHDLLVHDYGPGRMVISLHAEVPGNEDIFRLHDSIDNAERELAKAFSCNAVIHMDPIVVNDSAVAEMRVLVSETILAIDHALSMHDFRMVQGPTHTNLIFDVVAPFSFRLSDTDLKAEIAGRIQEQCPQCYCVIQIDKSYH